MALLIDFRIIISREICMLSIAMLFVRRESTWTRIYSLVNLLWQIQSGKFTPAVCRKRRCSESMFTLLPESPFVVRLVRNSPEYVLPCVLQRRSRDLPLCSALWRACSASSVDWAKCCKFCRSQCCVSAFATSGIAALSWP